MEVSYVPPVNRNALAIRDQGINLAGGQDGVCLQNLVSPLATSGHRIYFSLFSDTLQCDACLWL